MANAEMWSPYLVPVDGVLDFIDDLLVSIIPPSPVCAT